MHKVGEESSTPTSATGYGFYYPDSSTKRAAFLDSAGRGFIQGGNTSFSVASQLLGTSDTYVTGSFMLLPKFGFQAGTRMRWRFSVAKTNAGTATPIYNIRVGTAGATSDTARWTHTGVAQTAVVETGWFELHAILRNVGAAGVIQGSLICTRTGGTAATGLAAVPVAEVTSSSFDTTYSSGLGVGISINAGASSAWTVSQIQGDLDY